MAKLLMTCGLMLALTACATTQPAPMAATASGGGAASATQSAPAASTAEVAQSAPAATTAVKPQQAKLICEDSAQIGSHFHSRVCLTPEQVEARKKAARDMMLNSHNGMCSSAACVNGGSSMGPPR